MSICAWFQLDRLPGFFCILWINQLQGVLKKGERSGGLPGQERSSVAGSGGSKITSIEVKLSVVPFCD